jgi:glutamine synthetase
MSDISKVFDLIKEHDVKYVDLRFTDPRGKMHHTAQHICTIEEESFTDGIMFDGSSISGWKAINESDMVLLPDAATAVLDPFAAQPMLNIFCDVYDPSSGQPYNRDPRSIAKAAQSYMESAGIGDTAYFGPEAEFFVFDDVRYEVSMNECFYKVDSEEGPYNSGRTQPDGNLGHRPTIKGGYFPVPPIDSAQDLRAEMLTVLGEMGVEIEKHHHEVAASQHELGIKFATLVKTADNMQQFKYVVHNVAAAYGKTATFMPKPVFGDNGSGMHCHQSIWKDGQPIFAGSGYADLSDMALYYIGGIIKHARSLNAFTNPSTNSYKRLVPGYEAPVLLAYSARNRSASCRIPYVASPKGKRVEVRFPDPSANPYLAFAAMLMAGLDGIQNKIKPGDPVDKNLYDLPPEIAAKVPKVCHSLEQSLDELNKDREFLTRGGVFSNDMLDAYVALKEEELTAFRMTTHPIEFQMYYSL